MSSDSSYSFFENLINHANSYRDSSTSSSQAGKRVNNNQMTTVQKIIYMRFKYAMENISDAEIIK